MMVDLSHPDSFVEEVPHDTFDAYRAAGPVQWLEAAPRRGLPAGSGYWSATSHEHVSEVLRTSEVFSSFEKGIRMEDHSEQSLTIERRMLIMLDPPDHTKLRLVVNKQFLPRMIAELREGIEQITARTLDAVAANGSCDFVDDIAVEIPLLVVADLLGVEKDDRADFRRWSDTIVSADDPDFAVDPRDSAQAMEDLVAYGTGVLERKRRDPGTDVLSALATAESSDGTLTEERLLMFWYLLLIAGNETTRNALSNSIVAFRDHPDQWALLREDPDTHIDGAVEEILRYVSPVHHLRRHAQHDYELAGQPIKAGDRVVAWMTAANRDPEVFDDPHRFDITRDPNPHVAFGLGTHFCLGAHLARLELDVVLRALLERLGDLHVSGPPQRVRTNFLNGMKSLPVAFTPAA